MKKLLSILITLVLINNSFCGVINLKEINQCYNDEECYDAKMHPVKVHFKSWELPDSIKNELNNEYWLNLAKEHVKKKLEEKLNKNVAKNVIFFLGDGMGLPTLAATRNYLGGEEKSLSFEKFPYTGLVRTYCLDKKTPDSASTATAYLTGVKANYGTIGVNGYIRRKDCKEMLKEGNHTHSIGKWASDVGKSVGIVTTTRITHATPAGLYAHVADRFWENDRKLKQDCDKIPVKDIAYQLIHGDDGKLLKVMLGGGRREFCDKEFKTQDRSCYRSDGKNLTKEWLEMNKSEKRVYVENREQFLNVDPKETDRLFGLFQDSHLLYHLEAEETNRSQEQPTLEEMTMKAIEILRKNDKGYFLLVEGGKIDLAHHSVAAKLSIDETAEFSKAIQKAREMTNENDTLIVVTADHSHTMTISGYPKRHQNIFGIAQTNDVDNKSYMTINYANGKGFKKYFDTKTNQRIPPENVMTDKIDMEFPSVVPLDTETHGGEDVAVFASGPWSHIFTGAYEQNALPHLMAYAAEIGPYGD